MKVSTRGAKLIAEFEGGQSADGLFHPYRDAVGVLTIGYGHTHGVTPGSKPLTKAQALALLRTDLDREYGAAVNDLRLPLNQNQFDAAVSAAYNLGTGILANSSSFGHFLRTKQWVKAANSLLLYDHAGGRVLPGLTRRRQAERALFLSKPVSLKIARWQHRLETLRADARKHGWSRALRIRGRRLKRLIAR